MYVIMRSDDGAYVSRSGSKSSYTKALQYARVFPTRAAAEAQRCVENEYVLSVEAAIGHSLPAVSHAMTYVIWRVTASLPALLPG